MHPTRIFETPDALKMAWDQYVTNLKEQAKEWTKVQYVGKDGLRKEDPLKVPKTLEGFKRYCREKFGEVEQYFSNQDGYYNDFMGVCTRIREEIREDQIVGGLLGVYNASITARLNGLKDIVENHNHNNIKLLSLDPLSDVTSNDKPQKNSGPTKTD